ncbi:MAG: hypothetical protein WCN85_12330 [Burkholderiales bacterium]
MLQIENALLLCVSGHQIALARVLRYRSAQLRTLQGLPWQN